MRVRFRSLSSSRDRTLIEREDIHVFVLLTPLHLRRPLIDSIKEQDKQVGVLSKIQREGIIVTGEDCRGQDLYELSFILSPSQWRPPTQKEFDRELDPIKNKSIWLDSII